MKIVKIEKANWEAGLGRLSGSYRLFGPVKEEEFHNFKELTRGEAPDLNYLNTRLSPKAIIYPQSEIMFEYSLDESAEDHHIMNLVRLNFDTPEYKDPYWIRAYESTTLVGLACDSPCSSCFCTTAGCGPYHEEGLDILLVDADNHFLAKVLTEKGEKLIKAAGWDTAADEAEAGKKIGLGNSGR
jgi:hypothetical protein